MRGAGRREIGHGALAERAISAVLPTEEKWPYAMRVVSDILESNGSSSMATVCGASLSLMDAGVPLKAPVAGVAMGLVKEGDEYAILTDIAGAEDHYGDMDFKVAGTRDGITALQMDIKVRALPSQIMREALAQAQRGRMHILGQDGGSDLPAHARRFPTYAPRILHPADSDRQDPRSDRAGRQDDSQHHRADRREDRRGRFRPGQRCVERSGVGGEGAADYRRHHGDGRSREDLSRQRSRGWRISARSSKSFLAPTGLLHISEVAEHRIKDVRDELKEGDQVLVKVLAVEGNRIRLSRKAILKEQRAKMGRRAERRRWRQ